MSENVQTEGFAASMFQALKWGIATIATRPLSLVLSEALMPGS